MSGILVYIETAEGRPDRLSLEALAFGRSLATAIGGPLEAVLIGSEADRPAEAAATLGSHGVSTAHTVSDARLAGYAPRAHATALVQLSTARGAAAVVGPGSDRGNEVVAHAAALAGLPMAANVLSAEPVDGRLRLARQRWAGSLIEDAWLDGPTHIVTVAPHGVAVDERAGSTAPDVMAFAPDLSESDLRVQVSGREAPASHGVSLSNARVVVGGGRGVGSAEGFAQIEELAALLGGAVGVSRAVTSAGWRPHAEQVGQTGVRIAPDLYIACGISGAIQHIVGCKAAKRILAINTDRDAPIMVRADYAVIGDLGVVLPAINAEIRRATGR